MDPYLLLEVPHTATIEDIKKAYRRLAKKWHPDTNNGSKDAEEKFKKVQEAYECLTDPDKRAAVDAERERWEKEEAARRAKAAADRHARTRTYSQPPPSWRPRIRPWTAVLALLAFVFIVAALFGSNNGGTSSTSA